MLGKKSIFDSDDVGCYERGRAAHTGEASVDDDVIALREDQAMLITEAIWKTAYKLEQPFATRALCWIYLSDQKRAAAS
jgi:hypothetical protein